MHTHTYTLDRIPPIRARYNDIRTVHVVFHRHECLTRSYASILALLGVRVWDNGQRWKRSSTLETARHQTRDAKQDSITPTRNTGQVFTNQTVYNKTLDTCTSICIHAGRV